MDSFKYQGHSRTISLKNWSDEEYIEYLKSQAKDIISDLKKVYKPGKSFDPFCYPKHLEILEKYKVKTFDHHLGRSSGDLDILYLNNLYKSLEHYPVIYKYPFKLGYEIKGDFIKEAQNDLTSYKMIEFLPDEMSCKNDILNISWVLDEAGRYDSVQSGNVIVIASKHLSEEDLKNLENWIDGQNGDGIGESFEQQEWKHFEYNDEDDEYDWELCTIRSKGHLTESSDTLSEYETHITEFDINQYLNNNDNNFEMTL